MRKLGSKRRRGFTLIEVALATVTGSVLLVSMTYTSREMQRAVSAIHNEALLQTIVRDMQTGLDGQVPSKLSAIASTAGTQVQMRLDNYATGDMTMQLGGNYFMRFREGAGPNDPGGRLESSVDGVTWTPVVGIGARQMIDQAMFSYDRYTLAAENAPPADAIVFRIDARVRDNLLRITNRMHKADMVPMYLQDTYAPRSVRWSWLSTSVAPPGGGNTDGDPLPDSSDYFPWDPTRTGYPMGGMLPIALPEATLAGAVPGTTLPDIFDGGGPGNFGWLSWNGDGSRPYLSQMLLNPHLTTYTNPNNGSDHRLDIGDWISGNSGISAAVAGDLATWMNKTVTVPIWRNATGSGSHVKYETVGFARVTLRDFELNGHAWIRADFVGYADREGNLLATTGGTAATPAPVATPGPVATPSGDPSATPPVSPSPAPSVAPSPSPAASVAPSPSPSAAASPVASPSPTASPSPSPSPSPTPPPSTNVRPIIFNDSVLASLTPGGTASGTLTADTHFRWVAWGTTADLAALGASLQTPNSGTYTNPANAADTHLDSGDAVRLGLNNINNGNNTARSALNSLSSGATPIIVMTTTGNDGSGRPVIHRFAKVVISDPDTNGSDTMRVQLIGFTNSNGQ